ncbi:hypothetical protein K449DRAFT_126937 [Hypoxylon sp. EC38]|nr:hypothetical protein K449DRAFT_126937 [Hypoxylon sp. EC38]
MMARFGGLRTAHAACLHCPGLLRCLVTLLTYSTLCLLGMVSNSCLSGRHRYICSVVSYETSSSTCTAYLHGTPYIPASLGRMLRFSVDGWYPIVRGLLDVRHCRQAAARWKIRCDVSYFVRKEIT